MKLTSVLFSLILSANGIGQSYLNSSKINGVQEEIYPIAKGFMVFSRTSKKNLGVSFCEESGVVKWQKNIELLNRSSGFVVGENFGFVLNDHYYKDGLSLKENDEAPIKIYRVDRNGEVVNSEDKFKTFKNDINAKDFDDVHNDGMFTVNDKLYLWWAVETLGTYEYYLQKVNEDFSFETIKLKMKVLVNDFIDVRMSKPRFVDFDEDNAYFTQMSFVKENQMMLQTTTLNLDSMEEEVLFEEVVIVQDEFKNFRSSDEHVKSKRAKFNTHYRLEYKNGVEIYQDWVFIIYGREVTYVKSTLNSFYDCVLHNGSLYYYGRHSTYGDETTGYWYVEVKLNGEVVAAEVNDFLSTSHFEDNRLTGIHLYFSETNDGVMCVQTQKGTCLINLGDEIAREIKDENLEDSIVEFPAMADLTLELNKSDRSVSTVVDNGKVYTSKIPKRGRLLRVDKFD